MSTSPFLADMSTAWLSDEPMIATMRLILASAGLLIIYIDPAQPDRYIALTYTVLILYIAYSLFLYLLVLGHSSFMQLARSLAHWVDVGWYTLLIALSSGTSSIFFFGFYFSILVASFRWGFVSGLRVTMVSTFLFTIIGFLTVSSKSDFELNRFLLRPIFLLGLGYMMARWGGFEIALEQRLALLRDVTMLANPRFGIDRMIGSLMERLRAFYDVDACLLVQSDPSKAAYHLRRVDRGNPEGAIHAEPIPEGPARILNTLPPEQAIVCSRKLYAWQWWRSQARSYAYNVVTGERTPGSPEESKTLAAVLDAAAFITVPLRPQLGPASRLYLVKRRWRAFHVSDVAFLLQVIQHIMPILDNIQLMDRLASAAAEEERQRIARDLHDSVIQPYIGLQLGLVAIRHKLAAGSTSIANDIEQLIELNGIGVTDLRHYVNGLKGSNERESELLPTVRRFATKFAEVTGIAVHVEAKTDIHVNGRFAAEVFQMVAEGLSNVRRHTQALQATIVLARTNNLFVLHIENEGTEGISPSPFTPRSITERVVALGGQTRVEWCGDGGARVIITIPL